MKHFGYLKGIEFHKSNDIEIANLLTNDGLFEKKLIASGNSSNIKDGVLELTVNTDKIIIEPSKLLIEEFYSFIMNDVFRYSILQEKLEFFTSFNNQIFGLEPKEQKKIALAHFISIYNDNYLNVFIPFKNKVSETGINHTYNYGKLQMLYYQLNAFKNNLADKIKLNEYLAGKKDFFSIENLLENYDLFDEIQFEIWVQVLVELNDRFKFEDDLFFTKIKQEKDRFNRNTHIFKTFESLQFTSRKIECFKTNHKANIESLYQVLVNQELIKEHKENFIEFIKSEFEITLSKIISYDENVNYTHDERVKLFNQEWLNLSLKNE